MTNELDSKFSTIENRFDRVETRLSGIDVRLNSLDETNKKILEVLGLIKTDLKEFKSEMHEFKTETEEKFELIIDGAVTKTEFEQAVTKMATKDQLIHFTDRIDAKFLDFKHDVIESIRRADKKFLKFAV